MSVDALEVARDRLAPDLLRRRALDRRRRCDLGVRPSRAKPGGVGARPRRTFLGPLAWNSILHRAATDADAFFVDIPFKLFPVSWQDTGSGVFTLATASLLLGLALRREPAGRVLGLAATVAAVAFLVDIYCY